MNDRKERLIKSRIEQYAVKFIADRKRNTPITNETLYETFKNCAIPADKSLYGAITQRINEMKKDERYKFYDEE